MWSGIPVRQDRFRTAIWPAWLTDYARALEVAAGEVLEASEPEGISPTSGTAEAKGQGKDRDRLADLELRRWPLA
jgi:hypothetical protein